MLSFLYTAIEMDGRSFIELTLPLKLTSTVTSVTAQQTIINAANESNTV